MPNRERKLVSSGSDELEDISALWNAAIQRQELERSDSEANETSTTAPPAPQQIEEQKLWTPQEMDSVCLNGIPQPSLRKTQKPNRKRNAYRWDEDGDLVFSKKVERGSRIDCWLGSIKKGIFVTLHHESYLADETEAGEALGILGSWRWQKEMCKPPGAYSIVRNFWGEKDGIPSIRASIKRGDYDDNENDDESEFGSDWARLALSAFEDEET